MSAEKRSLEEMSLGEAPACVTPDGSRQRPNQIIKCFYGPVNYAHVPMYPLFHFDRRCPRRPLSVLCPGGFGFRARGASARVVEDGY